MCQTLEYAGVKRLKCQLMYSISVLYSTVWLQNMCQTLSNLPLASLVLKEVWSLNQYQPILLCSSNNSQNRRVFTPLQPMDFLMCIEVSHHVHIPWPIIFIKESYSLCLQAHQVVHGSCHFTSIMITLQQVNTSTLPAGVGSDEFERKNLGDFAGQTAQIPESTGWSPAFKNWFSSTPWTSSL